MNGRIVGTGLLALVAVIGYGTIADQAPDAVQEATAVASVLQERQLEIALEMYYLKHGSYPEVRDQELVATLYQSGQLQSATVPYRVSYQVSANGQRYQLGE